MSILVTLYSALLFFVLTPGILVTLPKKSSKFVVALVHAAIFGIIYHFTHTFVMSMEGMETGPQAGPPAQGNKGPAQPFGPPNKRPEQNGDPDPAMPNGVPPSGSFGEVPPK